MRDRRPTSRPAALLVATALTAALASCAGRSGDAPPPPAPARATTATDDAARSPTAEAARPSTTEVALSPAAAPARPLITTTAAGSVAASPAPDESESVAARRTVTNPIRQNAVTRSGVRGAASPRASADAVAYATSLTAALDLDRTVGAARRAYEAGRIHLGRQEWSKAEAWYREAIRLDGSVAAYHAALGSVMMVLERWPEAEAAYSAAVLIDLDNAEYRRLLKEARSHR